LALFWFSRRWLAAPHDWHLQELVDGWPMPRIHLQQNADDFAKVIAEVRWDPRILSSQHLAVKALHVLCTEWRSQCNHLIQYAT
jgi:hypothetical protein